MVDTGDGERTIVCGASNVDGGQTVAVAVPGAVMPGGDKLGKAKLRGIESDGMILSEKELELGEDHDGIMVLSETAAAGHAARRGLPGFRPGARARLKPNRPDCLGVYGVAREVHAITGGAARAPPWEEDAPAGAVGEVGRQRIGQGGGPRALPALHGPRVRERDAGAVPAVAAGEAARPGSARSTTPSTSPTT